ncbi:zincin-like metallopeptidase domain-containing protein [Gemmata sp. JC717]|uniref:ArdC family protein n=1 Tax=Gemmata algarum TaxID=2975278 RepID=UPI0021BAACCF|nr:zincin-like metallopeptidase domain-containing protein [Gemmata algarum]MDY3554220.1 zincin-like metallopeptidase domain-containing protein [Gemmata algarum]
MSTQNEIRQRVTDQIVAALESGKTLPWRRPWSDPQHAGLPANIASRQPYRGTNPLALTLVSMSNGWPERWWGTFNQWKELGCSVLPRPSHVRPGQWGTKVVYCKPVERTRQTDDGEREERFWILKEFTVFHVRQVEGAAAERLLARNGPAERFVDYGPAERVMQEAKVPIHYGGSRAAYNPTHDYITLPPRPSFPSAADFYGTAFHELAHATGHPTRLNRLEKNSRFGNFSYAFEELVAEVAGAFVCSELGVPDTGDLTNTTAYLSNWLAVLKGDPHAVFRACSQATAAADYLLARPAMAGRNAEPALAA